MKKGWYLTTQPIITANWNSTAASGSVWTIPFGGGVGRIMKLGMQPGEHQRSGLWQRRSCSSSITVGSSSHVRTAVPKGTQVTARV
jgi:hypothetical protein